MAIKDYSTTPGSNTSVAGINIAEGCPPGNVNDAMRQIMADAKGADFGSTGIKADVIAESTAAAGVTIDSVLVKDGNIPAIVPVGSIMFYPMSTAPTGWIKANGAAISRTAYAALFAAIGSTWGNGDGSTTFNIPDLRGEFVRAWDDGRGIDTDRVFGSVQADEIKSHRHRKATQYGVNGETVTDPDVWGRVASGLGANDLYTDYTGGAETRPRNLALLACIKY